MLNGIPIETGPGAANVPLADFVKREVKLGSSLERDASQRRDGLNIQGEESGLYQVVTSNQPEFDGKGRTFGN